MSVRLFEGPAGCGKTTRLISELATMLADNSLQEDQRVLALTRIHGSRRRLQGRLSAICGRRYRFECVTVDSFAWRLLNRWRALASRRFGAGAAEGDYDTVCRRAGDLLEWEVVSRWVARRFPIILVDEAQDSKGGQLGVIKGLASDAICLLAADEFQDLDGEDVNEPVSWAREAGEVNVLSGNHRTAVGGLLAAAAALREGRALPENGNGFVVLGAPHHNVGASFVSRNLTWWGSDDVAILTPVGQEKSPFVQGLVARVEAGPISTPSVGPHRIFWEASQKDEHVEYLHSLGLVVGGEEVVDASQLDFPTDSPVSSAVASWLERQRRILGRATFSRGEISEVVRAAQQRIRSYRRRDSVGNRAMTIHQAKNRQFECVVVLWPYQVAGDESRLRRLLYNAITRAKRAALVVVQDPQRLQGPPFKVPG